MPSFPLVSATVVMLAIAYTLVVPGTPRTMAKVAATAVIVALSAARLYLAVDHPLDVVVTVALAVGVVVNMFRFCTPNEVFPVTYRRARSAHLDLRGRRGDAIRQAVRDQFGFVVTEIEPIGWQWSSASTPLRLCVGIDPDRYVFGKLYAMSHVRADRWYKLGKTLRYGRLEDEAPFQSVRRLVQNEDHMLRLLHDVGIKSARAIGIVRLGPLREYLLLTEYFDGATEINEAEVDDGVIDEGLALVRQLWTAGLAHRDIKPANLLIKDRHMFVIDVGLVEIAPTRWRQGVDLANMMLVLALSTDANRVYRRALRFFSAEEIAEAFAAARGITCPSQLRTMLKADGHDLVTQFRALAPQRSPIGLQRWSLTRVGLLLAATACIVLLLVGLRFVLLPRDSTVDGSPACGTGDGMTLMAQAVPSATLLPCVNSLNTGWTVGGMRVERGRAEFWLDSDRLGPRAVSVTLTRSRPMRSVHEDAVADDPRAFNDTTTRPQTSSRG